MSKNVGKFVVSLDFELMWGVRDVETIQTYGEHIKGVHVALPKILDYFKKYDIHGTFATVGFLFFETRQELLNNLPTSIPQYRQTNLSPYGKYIEEHVGADSVSDPWHFAPGLIQQIKDTASQEIGTHTFSHFYCLEEGQTLDDFKADIKTALALAGKKGIQMTSIVFPRNQVNKQYLAECFSMGFTNYRSSEDSWIYASRSMNGESLVRRFFRLVDAYINISGHHCYSDGFMQKDALINIPSSRFLRPYSAKLRHLENLRLQRIKTSMTHAAKNGLLYHLWWHPHNFGINHDKNFAFLEKILQHYTYLNKQYSFKSCTMSEYANELLSKK